MNNIIEGLGIIAGVSILIFFLSYKEKIQQRARERAFRAKRVSMEAEVPLEPEARKARLKIPGYFEEKPNSKTKKYDEIDLTRMFI